MTKSSTFPIHYSIYSYKGKLHFFVKGTIDNAVIFNFYKHVDAKSLKIWKILAKNVQCFIMFALVSGFSKSYYMALP